MLKLLCIVPAFSAFPNIGHRDASYVQDAKQTCIKGLPQLASCSTDATDAKSNETTAKSLLHLAKGILAVSSDAHIIGILFEIN
jgi:hypothetical protein